MPFDSHHHLPPRHTSNTLCLLGGALLILLAPVVRGGNRWVALIGLEWIGLSILLLVLIAALYGQSKTFGQGWERIGLWLLIGSPLWIGLLQLVPVPTSLWSTLPGRDFYAELLNPALMRAPTFRPASLTPDATWGSVLASIPSLACFALAITASKRDLQLLMRFWIAGGVVQAVLGLLQLGPFTSLHFESYFKGAIGSFANSNHLASFLAMGLPLVLLEIRQAWLKPVARSEKQVGHAGWLWPVVLLLLLSAILATRSRAGVGTAVLVLVATVLVLPGQRENRKRMVWRLGAITALFLLTAMSAGLNWGSKLDPAVVGEATSARYLMFTTTWDAVGEFWPLGSGLGSFASVYPRFQPTAITGFVEHAHSDYVQLLMETGVTFVILAAVAITLIVLQVRRLGQKLLGGRTLRTEEMAMLVAGMGLMGLMLHSWVDFNLRIPALTMFGAFLLGVLLRRRDTQAPERTQQHETH